MKFLKTMDLTEEIIHPLTVKKWEDKDDIDFCSYYYKAIKRLLDIDNRANASYIRRYFKIFSEYYDSWGQVKSRLKNRDVTIINLLHDSLYFRFTYVYRNATILSSAVAFHFRNIHKQSPTNIERLIKKKLVKICSLGGCSASDIVAIVTVLESIAVRNGIKLDFRVSIIESDEQWKTTCMAILSSLKQFQKATWKITFINGNLSKKNAWTPETFEAIQEADIITMIRFLSTFNHKKKITKIICGKLQPRALLFILDRPLTELIEFSFHLMDSYNLELIHKELCDLHTLDVEAVVYFNRLYQNEFGDLKFNRPNTSFNVFINVWMKSSPKSVIKCLDNLERTFQNTAEKYNPKQSFLSSNAFKRWENLFTKEKETAGWKAKGIKKIVQDEKKKRNLLLVEIIGQKKKLDLLQKNLFSKLQLLKKGEATETDEESLYRYLTQKRHYSFIKKTIYYSSFRSQK